MNINATGADMCEVMTPMLSGMQAAKYPTMCGRRRTVARSAVRNST